MTNVVTGRDLPDWLLATLKRLGMPEECTSFKIELTAYNEPLMATFTGYVKPLAQAITDAEKFDVETKIYKLLLVE